MGDHLFTSAAELATSIRLRRVSVVEVLEAHLQQIQHHNPALNAIITVDIEGARRRAADADVALVRGQLWGPLHGVPVTIKDSLQTAGLRTTSGSPSLADYVPSKDATVVARIREAGAIVLGKTNLPTLGGDSQTLNPIFGRTNNPWDLTRTPGGSTGGGAAAVAAGLTALELGSDWGGSVRCPAHFCGVCTIKPSDHRVPWTGHIPPVPGTPWGLRHLAAIGPIARTIDDLALALNIISGPDDHDWDVPPVTLKTVTDLHLEKLHLAWADDFGVPVTANTRFGLTKLVSELERLNCHVERRMPEGFDVSRALELWGEIRQMGVGSSMSPDAEAEDAAARGVSIDSEVPFLRGRARAIHATMRHYTAALTARDALIAALEQFFDEWDAFLCPVASGPAFPHCTTGEPISVDDQFVPYWTATGAYCMPFNVTGHPVVVMPLTRSVGGLPIGMQIVGRRWDEMKLLAIASQLALIVGPFQKPPGY